MAWPAGTRAARAGTAGTRVSLNGNTFAYTGTLTGGSGLVVQAGSSFRNTACQACR